MKGQEGKSSAVREANYRIEVREAEVPPEVKAFAEEKRRVLIGTLADVDDVIADRFLMEEQPTVEELQVHSQTNFSNNRVLYGEPQSL
jgi:elongation factor G